ncbi:PaaI family thioesterase [Alicyclobacillus mengziensis]|uniref:PaaI family thioesterase n=1 Tax=Alicyclobacillus mengziensis TaxID=2931921 RepID=A0A9X7VX99_9BACL|nr:PaaI family thioesterase [Alicyclobacillus mengziensis]QSO46167.1 PaaI family thioesterase [Alicyclobacillus mengziensis]
MSDDEVTKDELLNRLAKYTEEDLEMALRAADAQKRTREEGLYFLHYLLGEDRMNADAKEASIVLPIRPMVMNPVNMVHGGITALLCDNVMGMASYMSAKRPGVTLDLSVRYHLPGRGNQLTARGEVVHAGGQVNSTRCEVRDDVGRLVATATGSFYHKSTSSRK